MADDNMFDDDDSDESDADATQDNSQQQDDSYVADSGEEKVTLVSKDGLDKLKE